MKRLLFFTVLFTTMLTSCSLDSDPANTSFSLEVLPIESVQVPEQFVLGETYEISMTYVRPNSCYEFNDFIYEINGHERTIAIVNTVYTDIVCTQETEQVTVSFDFTASSTNTYLFKFYQGEDVEGVDQYFLIEVPVVSERSSTSTRH